MSPQEFATGEIAALAAYTHETYDVVCFLLTNFPIDISVLKLPRRENFTRNFQNVPTKNFLQAFQYFVIGCGVIAAAVVVGTIKSMIIIWFLCSRLWVGDTPSMKPWFRKLWASWAKPRVWPISWMQAVWNADEVETVECGNSEFSSDIET